MTASTTLSQIISSGNRNRAIFYNPVCECGSDEVHVIFGPQKIVRCGRCGRDLPSDLIRSVNQVSADEQAFRDAIAASPNEIGPRQVYADWLEERGQSEEANRQRAWRPAIRPDRNRYVGAMRVSDKEVAFSEGAEVAADLVQRSRVDCRRQALIALAPDLKPGRYVLEVREESRVDRDNRGTELRTIVEVEPMQQNRLTPELFDAHRIGRFYDE